MEALKEANPLEWCLFRAMEEDELIDEELEVVEAYFKAIDMTGDHNGKISFVELIAVLLQTGIFIDDLPKNPYKYPTETPKQNQINTADEQASLKELKKILEKIDLDRDGSLFPFEFALISGDRD